MLHGLVMNCEHPKGGGGTALSDIMGCALFKFHTLCFSELEVLVDRMLLGC